MTREIPGRAAIDADFVLESEVGVANGVAPLDGGAKVPAANLPTSEISGALVYQSTWNASTNTPALASGVGTKGDYYVVSVAGSTTLDGVNDWAVGDWAVFNGAVWEKADHSDVVSSVNAKTGAVVLDADDIDDGATAHRFASAAELSKLAGIETAATADQTDAEIETAYNTRVAVASQVEAEAGTETAVRRFTPQRVAQAIAALAPGGAVDSVNGQTGAVVLDADDVSDSATTNKYTTAADISKLAGIEAAADVTDAANVAASGAVMDGDFSSNGLMKRTGAGTYATAVAGADYEAADPDILRADTTDTLTVGYQDQVVDGGNTGTGTVTPTFAAGNLQNRTMNGSFTLGVPTGEGIIVLRLKIDGTGGYTLTTSGWGKVIGTVNTSANKTNVLTLLVDSAESVLVIAAEA